MENKIFGAGEDLEPPLLNLVVRQVHHAPPGLSPAYCLGPFRRVAERLEGIVAIHLQAVLLENVDHDDRESRGWCVHGQDLAF